MNIRNTTNLQRTEALRSANVGEAGRVGGENVQGPQKVAPTAPAGRDSVEISAAARAAADDTKVRDLEFARRALQGVAPMSAERTAELSQRVQDGYYNQPDVVQETAARVADNLQGGASF